MKTLVFSLLTCFGYTPAFCDGPRYFIDEAAKPIITWDPYEATTNGDGDLSCGDAIYIQTTNTGGLIVSLLHGDIKKELNTFTDKARFSSSCTTIRTTNKS